jgi:subtilisin family serine protease
VNKKRGEDKKMKRGGEWVSKYFLSILLASIFSLIHWNFAQSEEAQWIKEGREGHPKMESALSDLQKGYFLQGREPLPGGSQRRGLRVDGQDKVTVFILPRAGETQETIDVETLKAYGGEILKSGQSVIKAKVPILLLDQIADHVEGVNFIKRPDRPHIGSVSEGVSLTGASFYQASGYTGQNVKVAIIDLEFGRLSEAVSLGVLPPTVVKVDCTGTDCASTDFSAEDPAYAHGTAVAEIVYEMAPGAQLYLIKVDDNLDLINAKDYCIAQGIRIINHSVGWLISNFYDGTCYFDNAVCAANHAYRNGILWVNAIGNEARSHYEAAFIDRDGDRLHNVTEDSNYVALYAYGGDEIIVLMTWDAWPATGQDYDLLLFDSSMNLVASSTNWQTGTQPPQEWLDYLAPTSGTYFLAVKNASATSDLRFSIFSLNHDLNPYTASSSLLSPADATGVMAVAAIHYTQWLTGPQEYFSSQGPTHDGRMKPEISGPDGVSSFIYGSFLGTSAASPHVAGAAALILSNNPAFTVDQLWNTLTSSAIDMGKSGQDAIFGYGRLSLSTIYVDPASIDFGEVLVGSFLERDITLRNIGNPNLTIGTITGPSPPYRPSTDICSGKSLPLGGACTVRVRFSPSSTGNFTSTLTLPSSDPFRSVVSVSLKGKGVLFINLSSPADPFTTDACSMDHSPLFEWEAHGLISNYEIQFGRDPSFHSVPFKIKASGMAYMMSTYQWKRILSIPGPSGGTIYWRVVGYNQNGNITPSDKRSILILPPQPVGDPVISPVSRNKLPVLTWENHCNVKFKVWFSIDPGFLIKNGLTFYISDPNLNGGVFSKELTSEQWQRIRRWGGDQPGTTIFWYVASWDALNRYSVSEVKGFVLTD